MRNRLGPLRSKSRRNAQSRNRLESSREMAAWLEVELVLAVDVGQVHVVEHAALLRHLGVQRRAGHGRVEHELVEIGVVRDGVLDLRSDVLGRVVLQADDGRAQQLDAVRAQFARQLSACRCPSAWRSWSAAIRGPSRSRRCPAPPVPPWCTCGWRWPRRRRRAPRPCSRSSCGPAVPWRACGSAGSSRP